MFPANCKGEETPSALLRIRRRRGGKKFFPGDKFLQNLQGDQKRARRARKDSSSAAPQSAESIVPLRHAAQDAHPNGGGAGMNADGDADLIDLGAGDGIP